jgi:DNA-binding MarR family transcriptional regulator
LANLLVMDRTTLGRNILPLERDGLIEVAPSQADRRRHELRLTDAGLARYRASVERWTEAQKRFGEVFGDERAAALRGLLREVVASDFAATE